MSTIELLASPSESPANCRGHVQLFDSLRVDERLWIRGRLVKLGNSQLNGRGWWRRRAVEQVQNPIHVDVLLDGDHYRRDAATPTDGQLDVRLEVASGGGSSSWRTARVQIFCAGQSHNFSNLVLDYSPSTSVRAVMLPLSMTFDNRCAEISDREQVEIGERLPSLEHSVERPLFYIAGIPESLGDADVKLAVQVALAGWPRGHFLICPASSHGDAFTRMREAADAISWLFSNGRREAQIINAEPGLAGTEKEHACFINSPTEPTSRDPSTFRATRRALLPRFPVVFCHGMLAFSFLRMQVPEEVNCFWPLREPLRERGLRALFPRVPATSGVIARAQALRDQIERWTPEPVNLIAHSMGGLDARYLITHLGLGGRVRSLTTISTPHCGTYLADWFHETFRWRVPLVTTLEAFGYDLGGFYDCRPQCCRLFNDKTPDHPRVRYFSFGGKVGSGRLSPALRRGWGLLNHAEGPNDGMVSMESSRWGSYIGTLHADHFAQTPDYAYVRPGEDFDSPGFYFDLLENLARRGF